MSEPNSQGEPTMEEILASIRKIISEDGPDAEAAGEVEAVEAPAEEPAPDEPPQAVAMAKAEPAADEDDDVLDLTQEVKEDGTVVDLKAKRDGAAAAKPKPESEPEPEPEPEFEPAETISELELAASPPPEPAMPEEEPEPEPEPPEEPPEIEAPEPEAAEPEPAFAAMAPAPEDVGLLSRVTRDSATASLVELAMTAGLGANGREGAGAAGQTLEMLVRDALRPYLKSWLDANLAPLVERIVREEIQKMIKRAEYR